MAGFHHNASAPLSSATAACPLPPAPPPGGRSSSGAPSVTAPDCERAGRATPMRLQQTNTTRRTELERGRLIDQHDRDVVADGVAKAAGSADERRLLFEVLEPSLAFRADENGEELRRDTHRDCSPGK